MVQSPVENEVVSMAQIHVRNTRNENLAASDAMKTMKAGMMLESPIARSGSVTECTNPRIPGTRRRMRAH